MVVSEDGGGVVVYAVFVEVVVDEVVGVYEAGFDEPVVGFDGFVVVVPARWCAG